MNTVYKDYTNRLKEGEEWKKPSNKPLTDDEVIELIRYHEARVWDGGINNWMKKKARKTIQALEDYLQIKDD